MKQVNYWIWLQRALGPAADLDRVLGPFDGNPRTLYETLLEEQRPEAECSVLTPNQYRKLKEEYGFADEVFARITSPIGLDIKAETPAEIAISIAAQLIELRARRNEE